MLGESPQRDRDIENFNTMIKNCATAGIPAIKYNLQIVGDLRIARTPGRGDATYATWKYSEAHPKTPLPVPVMYQKSNLGNASPISSIMSFPSRPNTRFEWHYIPMIPTSHLPDTRATIVSWGQLKD
jgi:D-mannonate dehydratase